jgi:hypothetical protein
MMTMMTVMMTPPENLRMYKLEMNQTTLLRGDAQFGEIPTTAKIILAMETSNSFCF